MIHQLTINVLHTVITLFAGMFSIKNSLDHEQVLFSILVNAVMNMVVTLNGRHQVKLIGRMTGVRKQVMITAMAINRTKSKPNQFQTQFTIPTVA